MGSLSTSSLADALLLVDHSFVEHAWDLGLIAYCNMCVKDKGATLELGVSRLQPLLLAVCQALAPSFLC